MAEIHSFPGTKLQVVPADRPKVPVYLEDTLILAHIGGSAAQLHLIAEYLIAKGKFDEAEMIAEAVEKVNSTIKKLIK